MKMKKIRLNENGFAHFFNERTNTPQQILASSLLRSEFMQKVAFLKETLDTVKENLNSAYQCISRMEQDEFSTDESFSEDLRTMTENIETMQIYAKSAEETVGRVYDLAEENDLV